MLDVAKPPTSTSPPCLRYRTMWLSDIHLGTKGCQAEALLDLLRYTESEFLYLAGDIVDAWQLKRRWYWPQPHNDVVQKILRRAHKGTKVFFIPGNHDEVLREFCGLQFGGVLITNQIVHTTTQGQRLLVLHGDQFDAVMSYAKWLAYAGDMAYTFILSVNTYFNRIRRCFGFSYWSLSAYLKGRVKNAVQFIGEYENFIVDVARRHHVDGVVCGHIHHAEMREIGPTLYVNAGDWVESCTVIVEDFDGKLSVIDWIKERETLLKVASATA